MENERRLVDENIYEKVMRTPLRIKKGECPLIESIKNTKELIESLEKTKRETLLVLMEFCRKSADTSVKKIAETLETLDNALESSKQNLDTLKIELDTRITTAIRDVIYEKKNDKDDSEEKEEKMESDDHPSEEVKEQNEEKADE